MATTTTFVTATGSTWSVTGQVLSRHHGDQDPSRVESYEAVPNALNADGTQRVDVRVSGTITFVDRGIVKTTGRIARVLRVASVSSAA